LRAIYLTRRYGSIDRTDVAHPLAELATRTGDADAAVAHARALLKDPADKSGEKIESV
jgi:hypothetical protein